MSRLKNSKNRVENIAATHGTEKTLFLTPDEVRAFPAFKDASDEIVEDLIRFVHDISLILYKAHGKEENLETT